MTKLYTAEEADKAVNKYIAEHDDEIANKALEKVFDRIRRYAEGGKRSVTFDTVYMGWQVGFAVRYDNDCFISEDRLKEKLEELGYSVRPSCLNAGIAVSW